MNHRIKLRSTLMIATLIVILVFASLVLGHTSAASALLTAGYDLTHWSVDSGGGSSTGGSYSLSGTLCQPDAGVLKGSSFTLTGGFWNDSPANRPIRLPVVRR